MINNSEYAMIYTVYLKDRINGKKSCFSTIMFDNKPDFIDNALQLKIKQTDEDYICYKIVFNELVTMHY